MLENTTYISRLRLTAEFIAEDLGLWVDKYGDQDSSVRHAAERLHEMIARLHTLLHNGFTDRDIDHESIERLLFEIQHSMGGAVESLDAALEAKASAAAG